MAMIQIELTSLPIQPEPYLAQVGDAACGAVNLFLGVTRNHHQQRAVLGLEYHCYEAMAKAELEKLAQAIAEEFQIEHLIVVHRLGRVGIGETSLLVAAASHHRHQVLEGTHQFINRLKKDVPIWKRESFADGAAGWVEGGEIVECRPLR